MSYIKPENLEVIQTYLRDSGPREQIAQEDSNAFAASIDSTEGEFPDTESGFSDGAMDCHRELDSKDLFPAPIQVSVLSAKHLVSMEESGALTFKTPEQILEKLLNRDPRPNDVDMSVPGGVCVKFTKPNLAMAQPRKQPVRVFGEAEVGGLTGRPLPLFDPEKIQAMTETAREFGGIIDKDGSYQSQLNDVVIPQQREQPELAFSARMSPVMANIQVIGRLCPMSSHEQPICVISDYELTNGAEPLALRSGIFDSALNDTATLPKSSPTGRHAIVASTRMELIDYWRGFSSNVHSKIRGLLRSKTKKGPKRKYYK